MEEMSQVNDILGHKHFSSNVIYSFLKKTSHSIKLHTKNNRVYGKIGLGQAIENLCNFIRALIKTSVDPWGASVDNPGGQDSVAGSHVCEYQRPTQLTKGQSWPSFERSTASAREVRPITEVASLLSEEPLGSARL